MSCKNAWFAILYFPIFGGGGMISIFTTLPALLCLVWSSLPLYIRFFFKFFIHSPVYENTGKPTYGNTGKQATESYMTLLHLLHDQFLYWKQNSTYYRIKPSHDPCLIHSHSKKPYKHNLTQMFNILNFLLNEFYYLLGF